MASEVTCVNFLQFSQAPKEAGRLCYEMWQEKSVVRS